MAYDTTTSVTDDVTDNLASYHNQLKTAIDHVMSATGYAAYTRAQSMTANVTLTDSDLPVQSFSPTAARDLTLPTVASTNHAFYVINRSATYEITVKNSGGTVISRISVNGSAMLVSDGANGWYVVSNDQDQVTELASAPPTPSTNAWRTFFKSDGLYVLDDAGTATGPLGAGGSGGGGEGVLVNGVISVTVASNNLTVAIKTLAGANPSAGDPVTIQINGVIRSITSALSVTKNAGTNWCNAGGAALATKEVDYFAYLIWNTTPATDVVDIGFARIPYGSVYSDFSGTTTNENYLAYGNASAPTSTDDVVNIGRFAATLSAGAGYTWTVPTFTTTNLKQRPTFETRELSFVFTRTVSGGTVPTYTAVDKASMCIVGRQVTIRATGANSAGGTAGAGANPLLWALPISGVFLDTAYSGYETLGPGEIYNNAGTIGVCNVIVSSASTVGFALQGTLAYVKGTDQSATVRGFGMTFTYMS